MTCAFFHASSSVFPSRTGGATIFVEVASFSVAMEMEDPGMFDTGTLFVSATVVVAFCANSGAAESTSEKTMNFFMRDPQRWSGALRELLCWQPDKTAGLALKFGSAATLTTF